MTPEELDALEARWQSPVLPEDFNSRGTVLALTAEVRRLHRVLRHVTHYSATGVADVGLDPGFAWVKSDDVAAALRGALDFGDSA